MHTRIICIDSEPARVEHPVEVLRASGCEVMLAASPQVGLALVQLFPPDLVLLHFELAGKLMQQIQGCCPGTRVILTGDVPIPDELLSSFVSAGAA